MTSRSVTRAESFSRRMKKRVLAGPKYPQKTCPWGVWRMTGTPASQAAQRPTMPALEVWVWTMRGLSRRKSRQRANRAARSLTGLTRLTSSARVRILTPRARRRARFSSTQALSSGPMADSSDAPATSRTS
ncbi:MAG: hypothetical protein A4E67_01269 [Syntrophaceae bacterium PtaB.Bin038]|nr:MAG: hypothetical protein A4E67_01269 [Syntrophaceae bacterium PtaB.Bin038]